MKTSPSTQWTHIIYKVFHSFINLTLIIAIILQILTFIIKTNDHQITIPEFLLTKIRTRLNEKQISFDANNITFKFSGEITLEDLKIKYANFTEPLITCDQLKINLNILSIFFGELNPEKLLIKNATFFHPSSLSLTGLNEPFIKNFFGIINFGTYHTKIEEFNFDFENTTIIVEGSWSNQSLLLTKNFEISNYLNLSTNLLNIRKQLSSFNQPVIIAKIKENEKKNIILDLTINALGFTMDKLTLGPINAKTELTYQNQTITPSNPLNFSTENIAWDNNSLSAKTTQGQIIIAPEINFQNQLPLIQKIRLSLNQVTTHALQFDSTEIYCNLSNSPIIASNISIVHDNNWLSIKGNININEKSINSFIEGDSTLEQFNAIALQFFNKNTENYKLNGKIRWKGQLQAKKDDKFIINKSELIITSTSLNYNNIKTDRLYAEVDFDSNKLQFPYINIEAGENYAKGSVFYDFQTQDYRYLLTGSIIPDFLNPYLDNWWKNLVSKFSFTAPMPFGNMDIRGSLSNTSEWSVFGEIQANNFTYLNVPMKQLSLRINSNEKELELMDLYADSQKGSLETYIRFKYNTSIPEKNVIYTFVNGSSSLPLHELDTIIDSPNIHNIIKKFSSKTGPTITVVGQLYNNKKENSQLHIQLNTNNLISYQEIPFEYMSFNANYTPQKTIISNIITGFAQGQANGSLTIHTKENSTQPFIQANARLISVNQEMAVESLQSLWKTQNQKKTNNYGGLINLNLETEGILGNWNSFNGFGKVSITQANLGKINLLWILSEILSLTPLGLGSLNFTDATSDFIIRNGAINFPNINIYGSTASIDGEGNFYLGSQNLDFILDISPLNKKGIPIISQVMLVLAPITQSFQMHLGGTLKDPKWETSLTPLGLFKKRGPGIPSKN